MPRIRRSNKALPCLPLLHGAKRYGHFVNNITFAQHLGRILTLVAKRSGLATGRSKVTVKGENTLVALTSALALEAQALHSGGGRTRRTRSPCTQRTLEENTLEENTLEETKEDFLGLHEVTVKGENTLTETKENFLTLHSVSRHGCCELAP